MYLFYNLYDFIAYATPAQNSSKVNIIKFNLHIFEKEWVIWCRLYTELDFSGNILVFSLDKLDILNKFES
jgi:hypothetical protein